MGDKQVLLRGLPKVDEVLQDERLFFFTESTPRAVIVDSVREVIDELRKDILEGRRSQVGTKETLMTEIVARITGKKKKSGGLSMQPGWCCTPTWEGQICRTRPARASWTWPEIIPIWNTM